MVEKFTETNGKQKIAKNGVVEAGKQERARELIGQGKEKSPDSAKTHSQPVAKNDVHEAKRQGACQNHEPAGPKEWLEAMKEKSPIQEFLWVNREQRIKKENQQPEERGAPDERKNEMRGEQIDGQGQGGEAKGVADQNGGKKWTIVTPGGEQLHVESWIGPQEKEGSKGGSQQIRDRNVGKFPKIDKQRNGRKNGEELKSKKKHAEHGLDTALYRSGVCGLAGGYWMQGFGVS